MPSKRFLRILIVAEILLYLCAIVVSWLTESTLPDPLLAYVQAERAGEITFQDSVLFAIAIPLLMGPSIGLFVFWRPARLLYFILAVAGVVLNPLSGPLVDSGWGQIFDTAAVIISGVILALVYYSPLKDLYERPKTVA